MMRIKDTVMLLMLAALWGASFLFMRVAVPVLGPIVLIDLRVLIAAIALLLYAGLLRQRPRLRHRWRAYLLLGACNAAIPFCLIAAAELSMTASLAAILNSMTPLFAAIIASIWLKEKLTLQKALGLLLGIAGVTVLMSWNMQHEAANANHWGAVWMSLGAALFYGIGGIYSAQAFREEQPLNLAIGQQLAAALLLLPFALFHLPTALPNAAVIGSVLALAVLSTALGYLLYFRLILNVGAVRTVSVTFLVPIFGIVWGWMFLSEALSVGMLLGLSIILLGVGLVMGLTFKRRRADRSSL
ncbi:DMT family transporter [Paenibacillus campi]|uniref:DMT family transporter n=1 Tax=Paenibacillus campi TaxID=3106031 RepID=UPI002AFEDD82|nr:DMT family transporter [Paenibacillus sp. SGZ-1009]